MFAARNNFLTPALVGGDYALGLSPTLLSFGGQNSAWNQQTIDVSAYAGATVRLVFYYQTTNSYTADIQLDDVNIDGTSYDFELSAPFETTTTNNISTPYTSAVFTSLSTAAYLGRWIHDSGGTPSGSTGLTIDHTTGSTSGYYIYAETSVSHPYGFWLRSPEVTLSSSPTLSFWEARYGASMGDCEVYLDVVN